MFLESGDWLSLGKLPVLEVRQFGKTARDFHFTPGTFLHYLLNWQLGLDESTR